MSKKSMIVAALLLTTSLIFAGGHGGHGGKGGHHDGNATVKVHGLLGDLNLTDAQITEIETLRTTLQTNIEALELEPAIKTAVASGSFDSTTFISASVANHTEIVQYIAAYEADLFALLTEAQQSTYVANIEDLNTTHRLRY